MAAAGGRAVRTSGSLDGRVGAVGAAGGRAADRDVVVFGGRRVEISRRRAHGARSTGSYSLGRPRDERVDRLDRLDAGRRAGGGVASHHTAAEHEERHNEEDEENEQRNTETDRQPDDQPVVSVIYRRHATQPSHLRMWMYS